MSQEQTMLLKIIKWGLLVNAFLISFTIVKHKVYWIAWRIDKPQTWWQRLIDLHHNWWYSIPREQIFLLGFIICAVMCFFISLNSEDKQ